VPRKLIIDLDPGIGDAVATVLALLDPELDVLALTATAGAVPAHVATRNLHSIVAQVDPPKWPRIGSAAATAGWPAPECEAYLAPLNGPTGLGVVEGFAPELHHRHESVKVLVDLVRAHPHQVHLLTLGPLTNVAAACDRESEFLELLGGFVCLGGSVSAGGDITAAAEANFYLDPHAAQNVLRRPQAKTLIPLDIANTTVVTFENFNRLSLGQSPATAFLKQLLPFYFRAHHQFLAMEGVRLKEVVALAAIARPDLFRLQPMQVDVEVRGDLTRGASVCERRPQFVDRSNTAVAVESDAQGVIDYLTQLLR